MFDGKTVAQRLYCVGHMVKDHSDSDRGNTLEPLFCGYQQGVSYMHQRTNRIANNGTFVPPVVEHWLEGK